MPTLTDLPLLFSALGLESLPGLTIMEAAALSRLHVPPFSPELPALIIGFGSADPSIDLKAILSTVYPADHRVCLISACGTESQTVEEIPIHEIGSPDRPLVMNGLFIPPLPAGAAFEHFQEVVAHLRAPDGCPWDREQTHLSLRSHLLEESYETLEALDAGIPGKMCEEFGDLLLQIVLNAQIASEMGGFTMTEVIQGIHDKIVRRHPHVFGEVVVDSVGKVLQNWEKIKAAERESNGEAEKSLLDGLPSSLPALTQAQEYQDRAARVGFDWPEIEGVLDKIREEIAEVRHATGQEQLSDELGDLMFALVNLARWRKIDAESALRRTNRKFKGRFVYIEHGARQRGRALQDLSLEEMEALWQEAKKKIG